MLDQVKVELLPEVMLVGCAVNVTVGAGVAVGAGSTVIDVAPQADVVLPIESVAQTPKSYCPGTCGVPVSSPFGLTIMPSGGVPMGSVFDWKS